jgi:hypothetical protein
VVKRASSVWELARFAFLGLGFEALPRPIIKLSEVRKLAQLQATEREAAGWFGVRVKAFKRLLKYDDRVKRAWEEGRMTGNVGLRRSQYAMAHHSAMMSKWLGKQYLGQRDTVIIEQAGAGVQAETLDLAKLSPDERETLRQILRKAQKDENELPEE